MDMRVLVSLLVAAFTELRYGQCVNPAVARPRAILMALHAVSNLDQRQPQPTTVMLWWQQRTLSQMRTVCRVFRRWIVTVENAETVTDVSGNIQRWVDRDLAEWSVQRQEEWSRQHSARLAIEDELFRRGYSLHYHDANRWTYRLATGGMLTVVLS